MDKLTEELDNRLDELFSEDDMDIPVETPAPKPKAPDANVSREERVEAEPGGEMLRDLNALLLSMEWEIDDDIMGKYLEEVARLEPLFPKDSVLPHYCRMLTALGAYLKREKVAASPDTLKVMQEIQGSFTALVDAEGLSGTEQEERFGDAYARFDAFRVSIGGQSSRRTRPAEGWQAEFRTIVREELDRFRASLIRELSGMSR